MAGHKRDLHRRGPRAVGVPAARDPVARASPRSISDVGQPLPVARRWCRSRGRRPGSCRRTVRSRVGVVPPRVAGVPAPCRWSVSPVAASSRPRGVEVVLEQRSPASAPACGVVGQPDAEDQQARGTRRGRCGREVERGRPCRPPRRARSRTSRPARRGSAAVVDRRRRRLQLVGGRHRDRARPAASPGRAADLDHAREPTPRRRSRAGRDGRAGRRPRAALDHDVVRAPSSAAAGSCRTHPRRRSGAGVSRRVAGRRGWSGATPSAAARPPPRSRARDSRSAYGLRDGVAGRPRRSHTAAQYVGRQPAGWGPVATHDQDEGRVGRLAGLSPRVDGRECCARSSPRGRRRAAATSAAPGGASSPSSPPARQTAAQKRGTFSTSASDSDRLERVDQAGVGIDADPELRRPGR